MDKPAIFYGAGTMSKAALRVCLSRNIVPACFVDADQHKHHKFVEAEGKRFEILPIDEAFDQWPDANVWITTSPTWYVDVYELLLARGLSKDRIYLPDSFKMTLGTPKHCPHIGHFFVLDGQGFKTCCGPSLRTVPSTGNFERDIEAYYAFCEQLRNSLNEGKLTCCADCTRLRDGRSDEPLKIDTALFGTGIPGGDSCNLRCCYCTYGETLGASDRDENLLELFQKTAEQLDIERISCSAGEISVSPYRDEILKIWRDKGWKGSIPTNAVVYSDEIAAMMHEGLVDIVVSLDSGTAETFTKVKGVGCFKRVLENLERYTAAGKVALKYIVLEGINDNAADVDGFVTVAKNIAVDEVIISRQFSVQHTPLTDNEYETIARLVHQCRMERLRYSFYNLLDCIRPTQGNALKTGEFQIPVA